MASDILRSHMQTVSAVIVVLICFELCPQIFIALSQAYKKTVKYGFVCGSNKLQSKVSKQTRF